MEPTCQFQRRLDAQAYCAASAIVNVRDVYARGSPALVSWQSPFELV
jgi:hypothetical protein